MNVRHDFGAREQRFFVVTSQGVNSSAVWPRLFVPGVQIDTPLLIFTETDSDIVQHHWVVVKMLTFLINLHCEATLGDILQNTPNYKDVENRALLQTYILRF